jgi:phosphoribosylpyrophosphate synthetase
MEDGPNDKLCRLLFFIGALKDAGAERVTAVVPYLCYARKDLRTQLRDPVRSKYVARLFEACGADAVITLDVHNLAAFENAFRCPATNLEALPLFVEHFARSLRDEKISSSRRTSAAPSGSSSSAEHSRPNCVKSRRRRLARTDAAAGRHRRASHRRGARSCRDHLR